MKEISTEIKMKRTKQDIPKQEKKKMTRKNTNNRTLKKRTDFGLKYDYQKYDKKSRSTRRRPESGNTHRFT